MTETETSSFGQTIAFPAFLCVGVCLLASAGLALGLAPTRYDPTRWYVGGCGMALVGLSALGVGTFARFCPTRFAEAAI